MYYNLIEANIITYSDIKKISLLRILELTHYFQYNKLQETLNNIDNYIDNLEKK